MGAMPYVLAGWLFVVGLYGIVTSRNFVHLVMCLGVLQSSTYVLLLEVGYKAGGTAPIRTSRARRWASEGYIPMRSPWRLVNVSGAAALFTGPITKRCETASPPGMIPPLLPRWDNAR